MKLPAQHGFDADQTTPAVEEYTELYKKGSDRTKIENDRCGLLWEKMSLAEKELAQDLCNGHW